MFSRNAASSRAIPFAKMTDQLNGRPVRFGANQSGMQDKGEDYTALVVVWDQYAERDVELSPQDAWEYALDDIKPYAEAFAKAGYHKQITGRLTEPFQMMKTIISATETDNFFWLRDDVAADPSIAELARVMKQSYEQSVPELLKAGEYHLPYIDVEWTGKDDEIQIYFITDESGNPQSISLADAIKVSCARCAAVSYRNEGYGLEKSLDVYNNLVGGDRKHASAFEHCATPMKHKGSPLIVGGNEPTFPLSWEPGISHADREGNLWSGNFKGFVQYRKLIKGENYHAPSRP